MLSLNTENENNMFFFITRAGSMTDIKKIHFLPLYLTYINFDTNFVKHMTILKVSKL
jgi:hypothetical protein